MATIHPATLAELAVITEAMPDGLRLVVQPGAWCALRYGEVFELRRKNLDTASGHPTFNTGLKVALTSLNSESHCRS